MKIHPTLGDRFAANLAKEREGRNMGQRAFARLIGVCPALVSLYEQQHRTPSLHMVEMISRKLGKKTAVELLM